MKHYLFLLLIFLLCTQIKGKLFDEDTKWQETCQKRFCTRIYDPLCISLDGIERTMMSRCHLKNFRCRVMKRAMRIFTSDLPVVRIKHEGECQDEKKFEGEN